MSTDLERYEALSRILSERDPMSIDAICSRLARCPEWVRRTDRYGKWKRGDPLPLKTMQDAALLILNASKRKFVKEDGRWRRRIRSACSFCLTENVKVITATNNWDGPFICMECAKLSVEALEKMKEESDRIRAHELAILSGKEILGA